MSSSGPDLGLRPLTARSAIASTLIGTRPPELPTRVLVAAAELLGVSGSAARTALSRMVAAGDLVGTGAGYRLQGPLLERQERQDTGRQAARRPWSGDWIGLVLVGPPRSATARAARRSALVAARLGELRDGVWIRPDNLDRAPIDRLASDELLPTTLGPLRPLPIGELWPIEAWADDAARLITEMDALTPGLEAGATDGLARSYMVSAAVLRLYQSDPLLPDELLPSTWPGDRLRTVYDRFDTATRTVLRRWFRAQR